MASAPSSPPLILFAPGAGAPSSSAWMRAWAERLGTLGTVSPFDYPYMLAGRKSPDRLPTLVAAHRQALIEARAGKGGATRTILAGKSMGSRIGCHLAVELAARVAGESAAAGTAVATPSVAASLPPPAALICFGYPLRSGATGAMRDEVLCALTTPVLFVQGSRDPLCPLADLQAVRKQMKAASQLFVVPGGDHSLKVGARELRATGKSQDDWDRAALAAIVSFLSMS